MPSKRTVHICASCFKVGTTGKFLVTEAASDYSMSVSCLQRSSELGFLCFFIHLQNSGAGFTTACLFTYKTNKPKFDYNSPCTGQL